MKAKTYKKTTEEPKQTQLCDVKIKADRNNNILR